MKILIAIATPSHLAAITFFVSRLLPETEKQVTLLRAVRGEERRAAALALLAQAGADLKQAGIAAEMKVAVGNAGKVVINEAKTGQYDLLIVGHTSAAGQPTRRFTGSVVRRLVAHAPCPVLVVGRETEASVEQILLCDAGTKSPSLIERLAAQLPGLLDGTETITILHVMSQISAAPGIPGKQLRADAEELIEIHAPEGRLLERDINLLRRFHVQAKPKVRHGQVVQEIMAEADGGGYGLVVIGAHAGSASPKKVPSGLAMPSR